MSNPRTVLAALAIIAAFLLGGCLAVAVGTGIGALAYNDAKAKQERTAFHSQNIEREKAGLKPLTWEEWRATAKPVPKNDALDKK